MYEKEKSEGNAMSVKRKKRNETDYLEENFWSSAKENNV
jgi:hypothetical protein